MKTSKRFTKSFLFAALVIAILGAAIPPLSQAIEPIGGGTGTSWEITIASMQRSALGEECPTAVRPVCREECWYGEPSGRFACFPE